jgi:pimeloyl-ACP methyl ester carboxylesterase
MLHRLGEIRQPTLIQAGLEDVLIPPGNARILAERIPNARLIEYPAAAHGYFDEVGFTAVDDMPAFLAEIDATRARKPPTARWLADTSCRDGCSPRW